MIYAAYIALGIAAGIAGGMFGLGGGTILIPVLVFVFGLSQHQAQGTSLAIMVPPIALLAAWRYWKAGQVRWDVTLLICLGFLFGGLIGANYAQGVSEPVLKRLFGAYLLIVSVKFLLAK